MFIRLFLLAAALGLLPGLVVLAHRGFSLLTACICGAGLFLSLGVLFCLSRAVQGYRG